MIRRAVPGQLACALLLFLLPVPVFAGAWTQAPGSTFAKVSVLSQSTGDRWGCRGGAMDADSGGEYVSRQLFLYAERGWTERTTLVGSFALKDQRIEGAESYGTRSTGDLRLGARVALVRGFRPVALEGTISVPTYPRSDLAAPVGDREQFLPAGSGRVEGEVHLLSGISFFPLPFYGNLDLGYRERGGAFGDQWLAAIELGGAGPWFFAKGEVRWTLPDEESCEVGAVGAVALHERLVQVAPEVAFRVRRSWWLGLGYAEALSGRNALQGGQWSLGLLFWPGGGS